MDWCLLSGTAIGGMVHVTVAAVVLSVLLAASAKSFLIGEICACRLISSFFGCALF